MSELEKKARLRREQDILDRIDNVKRLIQMETTLLTVEGTSSYIHYKYSTSKDEALGSWLLNDIREQIQLQLLSIVALCNGDNPDIGEPAPMLEWNMDRGFEEHPEERFRDVWKECLMWNA